MKKQRKQKTTVVGAPLFVPDEEPVTVGRSIVALYAQYGRRLAKQRERERAEAEAAQADGPRED